jgi:hypothetical protein
MNPNEILSSGPSYVGHVRNGIVVLDTHVSLVEGQTVRVEPLSEPAEAERRLDAELAARVLRVQQLFEEWNQEDSQLSSEEADRLHVALEANRGLEFRPPDLK